MIKILHPLLCYYPSQAGGPANTLYWLNKALPVSEFSATVVSTTFGVVNPSSVIASSETSSTYFLNSKGKSFVSKSISLLKTTDVVQFSSLFFPPTLPLLFAAVYQKKAIIMSPRGELYPSALEQKSLKKKLWLAVIKCFEKHINFHATNTYEQDIIEKHFLKAKGITVIPNYIELPEKITLQTEVKFVFVGRINPIKNIDLLIEAFALVKQENKAVILQIVGSARLAYEEQYLVTLKAQVKQLGLEASVQFLGHLDGEKKERIIASSAALILPSKSENFGNVVLEALAHGTPVIASKNTPWEVLNNTHAGYCIDTSVNELTKTMLKLLSIDTIAYKEMRKNAYTLCKSKFDIQANIKVWENYYKTITAHVQK